MTAKTRQWALILGASSGTGAAIARKLAAQPGLDIFGVHRGNHLESAARTRAQIESHGGAAYFRIGDAGTAEGAALGARELLELAGPGSVSIIVHCLANASVGRLVAAHGETLAPRQIQKTFDSMAHSFVYWTQELLDLGLLAPGAQVLGLSNWMEDSVMRGAGLIAATKATLAIYVRHLAHELGPLGYRVNLLKFGGVFTEAVEKTFGPAKLEQLRKVLVRASAHRNVTTVDDVADFVSLLASGGAGRFNGATIDFTGGESQALFDSLMYFDTPPEQVRS